MSATRSRFRTLAATAVLAAVLAACGSVRSEPAGPHTNADREAKQSTPVRIWPGAPPGTASWSGKEIELDADVPGAGRVHIVTNVTQPTLTMFSPDPSRANGAAMIVLPGGAFRALAWDLDGTEVANWLAARGIAAFVLKYRVRPPGDSAPAGSESFDHFFQRTEAARGIAIADAQQALRVVRANAGRYGVNAERIGMIGFSAGAMATVGAALGPDKSVRPDFAIAAYGAMPEGGRPAADGPPIFIVAAQDDPQVPPAKSIAIDQAWGSAGLPVELHLYEKGGHGFGMRKHGLPVDGWTAALEQWLASKGLATMAPPRIADKR